MFPRSALLGVVISLAGLLVMDSAAGEKADPGQLITKVGTYRIFRKKLTIEFYQEKGKLNYQYILPISARPSLLHRFDETVSSGPAEPWIEKGSNWFALAESNPDKSPRALWIFSGRDRLVQIAFGPREKAADRGIGFFAEYPGYQRDSDSSPEIVRNAPRAVRDRLPGSFKKKFER